MHRSPLMHHSFVRLRFFSQATDVAKVFLCRIRIVGEQVHSWSWGSKDKSRSKTPPTAQARRTPARRFSTATATTATATQRQQQRPASTPAPTLRLAYAYAYATPASPVKISETPGNDPVLLWLNGGPGASSLAGCFSENGPLIVNPDGRTLRVNEFAWNHNANMLCIESPLGVGFSYNASHIYQSDDHAQAEDLYWMLQAFFDKFPWLRTNDLIVSGESYGGVYVPLLAKRIVDGNKDNETGKETIQLTKFAVGNGVNEFMALSKIAFAYYHALISTEDYQTVVSKCPHLLTPQAALLDHHDVACREAVESVSMKLATAPVNTYDVNAKCSGNPMDGFDTIVETLLGPPLVIPHPIALTVTVCLNWTELITYFNLPDVRVTLHAKPEISHWNNIALTSANLDLPSLLNVSAEKGAEIIRNKVLSYTPTLDSVVTPVWKYLLAHGVQGVIYHGDTDLVCDLMGGLWAVESLNLPRRQKRAAWMVDGQVGGFVEDFGVIKYVTVRGSGHMVPKDKPKQAKTLLDRFVLAK